MNAAAASETPKFINRELSWLEFNQRVLDEAADPEVPLLEQLKFIAITASNLNEFFMVRVGGLKEMVRQKIRSRDPSGLTPARQLEAVALRTHEMVRRQYELFASVSRKLAAEGVHRAAFSDLDMERRQYVEQVFNTEIFPVITPVAVGEGSFELPPLSNLGLNIAVRLKAGVKDGVPRHAVVPIRGAIERIITLSSEGRTQYLLAEEVIKAHIGWLFPGEEILETSVIRITRNARLNFQDEFAANLLSEMESVLDRRKESHCVRLEAEEGISGALLGFLQKALRVRNEDTYLCPGPIQLGDFMELAATESRPALRTLPWQPLPSLDSDMNESIFKIISRGDILLCHPYESFDPVLRLLNEAAEDPDVMAVKQTLYRVSKKSPVVEALCRAAAKGKYVTAVVELKARFDEARNINWAKKMERAGVQVIYGVKGLKTHAKALVVVRREPGGVVRYMHFGTGNYNEQTARLYSDISLLTCREAFGADASAVFNSITGFSQFRDFRKLAMAPMGLRDRFLQLIETEIERRQQGQKAEITAKMNSLVDKDIIEALYRASQAGIRVRLNIRGVCCLRPGVPGHSENISVLSIIDRFLEHSRIYCFHHGGEELMFISSADWMTRNLNRRVELMVPVEDKACRAKLKSILETYYEDNVKGRVLLADGSWEHLRPKGRQKPHRSQEILFTRFRDAWEEARKRQKVVLEPHRPPEEE